MFEYTFPGKNVFMYSFDSFFFESFFPEYSKISKIDSLFLLPPFKPLSRAKSDDLIIGTAGSATLQANLDKCALYSPCGPLLYTFLFWMGKKSCLKEQLWKRRTGPQTINIKCSESQNVINSRAPLFIYRWNYNWHSTTAEMVWSPMTLRDDLWISLNSFGVDDVNA